MEHTQNKLVLILDESLQSLLTNEAKIALDAALAPYASQVIVNIHTTDTSAMYQDFLNDAVVTKLQQLFEFEFKKEHIKKI